MLSIVYLNAIVNQYVAITPSLTTLSPSLDSPPATHSRQHIPEDTSRSIGIPIHPFERAVSTVMSSSLPRPLSGTSEPRAPLSDKERIKALEEDVALFKKLQLDNYVGLKMESGINTIKLADLAEKFAEYQTLVNKGLGKRPTFDETSAMIGKETVKIEADKLKLWEQVKVGRTRRRDSARMLT